MVKIVPAILADNLIQFKIQWQKIAPIFPYVQLDIMDGRFVKAKTKFTPQQIKKLTKNHQLEIHLMVNDVKKYLKIWSRPSNVKKIIWHWEADHQNIDQYLKFLKTKKIQAGLAVNPKTKITQLEPLIKKFNTLLVMNVTPGAMGQKSPINILQKIKVLRKKYPHLNIEVDGGVSDKTARNLKAAGANLLASGSYLQQSKDLKIALKKLK